MNGKSKTLLVLSALLFTGICSAKTIAVSIYKMQYSPAHITIEKGDTVVWNNIEKRQYHNVWFKADTPEEPDYIFPDETFTRTFDTLGQYNYECGPHPKMQGTVTVVDATSQ